MTIRPVGAELFHADWRTDMTNLTVALRNFANAPKQLIKIHQWHKPQEASGEAWKAREGGWEGRAGRSATLTITALCTAYKDSVRTSQKTQRASIRNTSSWMFQSEINYGLVCFHTRHSVDDPANRHASCLSRHASLWSHKHLSSSMSTTSSQRCLLSVSIGTAAASVTLSLSCVPPAARTQVCYSRWRNVSLLSNYLVSSLKGSIRTNGPSGPRSSVSGQTNKVLLQRPSHEKCHSCWREEPMHVTVTIAYSRAIEPRPACPKWHEGFTDFPVVFFLFLLPDQRLYVVKNMSIYTVYTHIWHRMKTVNESPLLPDNTQVGSGAKCLLDIYHWGVGLSVTGRICDTG